MVSKEHLKSSFERAGLKLDIAKDPFVRGLGMENVFALDIRRKVKGVARTEYFLCYPGHEDNVAVVADVDVKIGQLVLSVKEPKHEFWESTPKSSYRIKSAIKKYGTDWKRHILIGAATKDEDIREDKNFVWLRHNTPEARRHFLMGLDERQLFMAQLPRPCSTVKQAHESMKSPTVVLAEGKQLGRTYRQGEWFFLNLTPEEQVALDKYLKSTLAVTLKKVNIGQYAGRTGGKPHMAEELVRLPAPKLAHGFSVRQRDEVFVRGYVRHPDHETLKIGQWRKVILNQEGGNNRPSLGGTWID
jgi:hypothetical protein